MGREAGGEEHPAGHATAIDSLELVGGVSKSQIANAYVYRYAGGPLAPVRNLCPVVIESKFARYPATSPGLAR